MVLMAPNRKLFLLRIKDLETGNHSEEIHVGITMPLENGGLMVISWDFMGFHRYNNVINQQNDWEWFIYTNYLC